MNENKKVISAECVIKGTAMVLKHYNESGVLNRCDLLDAMTVYHNSLKLFAENDTPSIKVYRCLHPLAIEIKNAASRYGFETDWFSKVFSHIEKTTSCENEVDK